MELINLQNINKKIIDIESAYVSVITCTNRINYMDNIFNNFLKQRYKRKQLIIILNNNVLDIKVWQARANLYNNIKIFQLDESISLGECLNFGVIHSDNELIAKFDDDDFYSEKYLSDSIKGFKLAKAGVIGKSESYLYFEEECILALRNPKKENCYVTHLDGPSMIIKREVFNYVKFRDITRGEDKNFCIDCINKGINLYSINKYNHIYFRHASLEQHTWKIENRKLLKQCKTVARNVKDIKDLRKFITRNPKEQIKNWYRIFKNKVKYFIDFIVDRQQK
jgi:hypothetical protein